MTIDNPTTQISGIACGFSTVPEEGLHPEVWQQALEENPLKQTPPQVVTIPEEILALVERRRQARQAKDWATADASREQLIALGWMIRGPLRNSKYRPAHNLSALSNVSVMRAVAPQITSPS